MPPGRKLEKKPPSVAQQDRKTWVFTVQSFLISPVTSSPRYTVVNSTPPC